MKWLWVSFVAMVVLILAYLLKRGSASGSEVTATINGRLTPVGTSVRGTPTVSIGAASQLGVPADLIGRVSNADLSIEVEYFVDPATGYLIENDGTLVGKMPIVVLTDYQQANAFVAANPDFYKWLSTRGQFFTL